MLRGGLQGHAPGAAAGTTKSLSDAVDITIPRRVVTEDINRYMELAFGDTFELVPASTAGKVRLRCTRKTTNAVCTGVIIRGEEIKAHAKKKREATTTMRRRPATTTTAEVRDLAREEAMAETARAARKRPTRRRFVGCYGCGGSGGRT